MIYLISVVALICIWVFLKWKKVKNYWLERNVPHSPPHPIFGSLDFLHRQNINIWLREIYDKFKTPYIGVWFFWRPALVINSPVIARNILVKDSAVFRDRLVSSGHTDPLGGLNLFTVKMPQLVTGELLYFFPKELGLRFTEEIQLAFLLPFPAERICTVTDPTWTNIRRQLTGIFTSAKLRTLQGFLNSKGKELVERIKNENKARIDLRIMFTDYSTDLIGSYAFGVYSNCTSTGEGVLRDVTKEFMKYSLFRTASWISIFFIPELVDVFRFKYFPRCTIDYFRRIFKTMSKQRETSGIKVGDMLDVLLKIQKENSKEEYSDDFITAQAAIMLLGGFDGTGTILTYITYEMAYNPDIQEKAYQELLEVKKKAGANDLDYQALADAVYFNCIIKESLRKYVSVGWLDRIAASDYKVDDNLTIKAGTTVYINMTGMHFDPNYFPEPNKFDPDRFMPQNEKKIVPYTFLPFGEGPRICIGKRFGLITIRYAISYILLNYKIMKFDDCPAVADVKTEKLGLFLSPGEPLHVQFVPRVNK